VKRLILNGSPFSWRAFAFSAKATVTTFGVPEAVKPDKPTLSPFFITLAASSAEINGMLICNV
jgi:hypothetical protein